MSDSTKAESKAPSVARILAGLLGRVPPQAKKLFCVIVREAFHGPIHPKLPGVATPAEILEACGLDVGEFYSLLDVLRDAGLIEISGDYPMEEIRLTPEATGAERLAEECTGRSVPLEDVLLSLPIGEI